VQPTLSDKMSYPDIKKCMAEVTAARKQIAGMQVWLVDIQLS